MQYGLGLCLEHRLVLENIGSGEHLEGGFFSFEAHENLSAYLPLALSGDSIEFHRITMTGV
jgi:hypothetical protein